MSPTIEAIIEIIKDLPLKEVLTSLVALKFVFDTSKKGYEKIKKVIQDKHNEGKYAFVPNKAEANRLLEFQRHPDLTQVMMLVPNYRYIDIIRTGLLIDYYHKNNTPEDRERVTNIKFQIINRPNGKKLLKLVNLPTTPFFSSILQHLYELKKVGYSAIFLEEKFEEIVQDWGEKSKLVKGEETKETVVLFCKDHIKNKSELFFILGMKSASKTVEGTLEDLKKDSFLVKNGYTYKLTKSEVGNHPRTEIMFIAKHT